MGLSVADQSGWRPLLRLWRALFFRPGPLPTDPTRSMAWNRGNYLAHAVAHCEECHTPRNALGGLRHDLAFSGNIGGPDGQNAPNITGDGDSGIGAWSEADITHFLQTGETPDFDAVASGMAEVIRGTRWLSDADRQAMAVYLKTIPAIRTGRRPAKSG